MDIHKTLQTIIDKKDLSRIESRKLADEILSGKISPVLLSALLVSLRMKGESISEIGGFVEAMRKHMVKMKGTGTIIDTCGTGGDRSNTFNVSTTSAFVVAGCDVPVAKHGNRGISSKCGSADVLEELGICIDLNPEQAHKLLLKTNFTFLFAPLYHPAMKNVASIRKELKLRTIFNFLGPFVNPYQVKSQIIGVPGIEIAEKMSEVAKTLNYDHLLIVTSKDGLDEASVNSETEVFEIRGTSRKRYTIRPEDYGFKRVSKTALSGNGKEENAKITRSILKGDKGPKTDIVLLNSALALYVCGKAKNIKEGVELAKRSIFEGKAQKVLTRVIEVSQSFSSKII